jgi:hypothetical protein
MHQQLAMIIQLVGALQAAGWLYMLVTLMSDDPFGS